MKERQAAFAMLVGTNGTGKSTFMVRNLLDLSPRTLVIPANHLDKAWTRFAKIKPDFKWITDPNDYRGKRKVKQYYIKNLHSFKGVKVLDTSELRNQDELDQVFEYIAHTNTGIKRATLIVDDAGNWIKTKGTIPYHVRRLFADRRHRELDIFLAFHSFQQISADLIQYAPAFVIFRTDLPPNKTVLDKISNSRELLKLREKVNRESRKNPFVNIGFRPLGC